MEKTKLTLFDDYWIDFRPGTVRRWFAPTYENHYRDPYYEGCSTGQILWYPELRKYRMFYNASPDAGKDIDRYLCLAESTDGIHFTPEPIYPDREEKMRHVIHDCSDGKVLDHLSYDPMEPDPQKRFKCAALYLPDGMVETANIALILATSPDGFHWSFDTEHPLHRTTSDADNMLLYNPFTEEYMLFFRAAYVDRRICYKTSKDLKNWSDAVVAIHPGACYNSDGMQMQLYGMVPTYADGLYYGMVQRFYTSLTDQDYSKMFGFVETELYYSYDGKHYMPTSGQSVAPRPAAPAYGCTQLYLHSLTPTADGRDYLITGSGARIVHGTQETNKELSQLLNHEAFGVVVYRIRKDGFCGLDGPGIGAKIITKSVQLLEDDLSFNLNAACGYARFGVMDKSGNYLEGFTLEDSQRFTGDSVEVLPRWNGHSLKELLGQQVRVVVELNNAMLHAISFTGRPYIRRPQESFASPTQLID